MDLERLRLHHYEHSAGREEEVCRCGHEADDHLGDGFPGTIYFCRECRDCPGFSPPEPDYDAIFERRREEKYFG